MLQKRKIPPRRLCRTPLGALLIALTNDSIEESKKMLNPRLNSKYLIHFGKEQPKKMSRFEEIIANGKKISSKSNLRVLNKLKAIGNYPSICCQMLMFSPE